MPSCSPICGQAAERSAQVGELLLALDRDVGGWDPGDQPRVATGELVIALERNRLLATGATEVVDARILRYLVNPRLEQDRTLAGPDPAQRRDEDLLRDVLGAAVVADHPVHVSPDLPAVARVERLKRSVIATPHGSDQIVLGARRCGVRRAQRQGHGSQFPCRCIRSYPGLSEQ
jgi:hypothetical protein